MTKEKFAKTILEIVDNSREIDNKSNDEIVKEIASFLSIVEPKDIERFAIWGMPEDKSTVQKCWVS